jgi:DNA invertase Pin-like site-specific DNA recombinase
MRLVAYIRVSGKGQVTDGYGLDIQRDAIEQWARRYGHEVVRWCADEGVSGTTDAIDREGLSCALTALESGEAEGLVIPRLDRLARAVTVQEAILAALWRDGASVYTTDAGEVMRDDPDDPMRTAMREMAGVFAGLERRMIVKRLRDGRKAKAAAGGHAVGAYPFGQSVNGPVEREQKVLALIAELLDKGWNYSRIARELNSRGPAFAPRNAAAWRPSTLTNAARHCRAIASEVE